MGTGTTEIKSFWDKMVNSVEMLWAYNKVSTMIVFGLGFVAGAILF
jgi:hypothetical protein